MIERLETLREIGELSDLDLHFARLMGRLAGHADPELLLGASLASRATAAGHVCVDLGEIAGRVFPENAPVTVKAPSMGRWTAALERCEMVATADDARGGDRRPMVLDERGRLYLFRYWSYQDELAERLLSLAREEDAPLTSGAAGSGAGVLDGARLRERLDALFPRSAELADGEVDWQKVAAAVAVMRRLCIVSGGPGTGKTTTVTKILALLVEAAGDRPPRIGLAAPTGKAAARMVDAIRAAKQRLALDEAIANAIPDDAKTIHRLLGYKHGSVSFRHDADHPLPLDVLVVDEASMVDIALMAKLVRAMPSRGRLILIGDRDQLASVEAGAVLGDICARPSGFSEAMTKRIEDATGERVPNRVGNGDRSEPAGSIADSIVLLTRSYRFGSDSGIGAAAAAVNAGDGDRAFEILRDAASDDVDFDGLDTLDNTLREGVLEEYGEYLEAEDPAEVFEAFDRFRVLCARRTGPHGIAAMNARVEEILADADRIDRRDPWYVGRPILVTENDYGLRLFNGDIGIVLPDPERDGARRVFFPAAGGGVRKVAPARLPSHETAFAMTVHKSQGSEFGRVLLVLPDEMSPVLTRELIYTGLTRARRRVDVRGDEAVLREAITTAVRRSSGLRDALWGSGESAAQVTGDSADPLLETKRAAKTKGRAKDKGDEGQLGLFD